MLLRCTRSLVVPTSDRGVGVSRSSLVVPWTQQRTFKRKKLTNEDIQKAIEAKKKQRKSYLDKYYAKYQKERGDRQIASDREDLEAGIKGRDKKSKKSLNNRGDTRDMAGYRGFAKSYMNELREELADSTDPSFAERSRRKAYELHLSEPRISSQLCHRRFASSHRLLDHFASCCTVQSGARAYARFVVCQQT